MKKILLIILLFVISSCGNTYNKKDIPSSDSIMFQIDTMMPLPIPTPPKDSGPIIAEVQRDSVKIRKEYPISKLDTSSVIRDLRKHIEVIDSQQRQLDSLLKTKKK